MNLRHLAPILLVLAAAPAFAQSEASPQVTVERTYWVRPGKEQQFIALFNRTQLPRLKTLVDDHRVASFSTTAPLLHTSSDQWAFRVTIQWASWDAFSKDASTPASPRGDAKRDDGAAYEQSLFNDLVTDRKDTVVREQSYHAGS